MVLLLTIIVVTSGVAIGTSSKVNTKAVGAPPATSTAAALQEEQDPPGIVNGAHNPDLIPDRVAYSLIFRLISEHQGEAEKENIRAYIRHLGLGKQGCKKCLLPSEEADVDALIAAANEFKQRVGTLDTQAGELRSRHRENLPPTVKGQLTQLQRRKDAIVAEIVASLPKRLSANGHQRLRERVRERVKSRVKMAPKTAAD
jgi:acetylornithine deacetylase/succinyl-diaminopimelate desuccinylase-like protein